MKPWLSLVAAGWLIHSAGLSLYEDSLGMEGCIRDIANHWVTGWITVPLALLLLLTACLMIKSAKEEINTPPPTGETK